MENLSVCMIVFFLLFCWIAPIIVASGYARRHNLSGAWILLAVFFGWLGLLLEIIIGYSVAKV